MITEADGSSNTLQGETLTNDRKSAEQTRQMGEREWKGRSGKE